MTQPPVPQKRVQFDFDVEFLNGGGLQGQGFRLDIDGDDITDDALANYLVRDLRLLMVGRVVISRKTLLDEPHKRSGAATPVTEVTGERLIDLSHTIEDGMITYKGLPAPLICDHLSRLDSRKLYAEGTEFQIGKITMVSNTGTYLDSPFHRYADGDDLSALRLDVLAGLDAVVVRVTGWQEEPFHATHSVRSMCVAGRFWCTPAGHLTGEPISTSKDIPSSPKTPRSICERAVPRSWGSIPTTSMTPAAARDRSTPRCWASEFRSSNICADWNSCRSRVCVFRLCHRKSVAWGRFPSGPSLPSRGTYDT